MQTPTNLSDQAHTRTARQPSHRITKSHSSKSSVLKASALKAPRFDLSDDEQSKNIARRLAGEDEQSGGIGGGRRRSSAPSGLMFKFRVLNLACTYLQNPPPELGLKKLALITEIDLDLLKILVWNIRHRDPSIIVPFQTERQERRQDLLQFLRDYIGSVEGSATLSHEGNDSQSLAEAGIQCLRQSLRDRTEQARQSIWASFKAVQSDMSVVEEMLREVEKLTVLKPEARQPAFDMIPEWMSNAQCSMKLAIKDLKCPLGRCQKLFCAQCPNKNTHQATQYGSGMTPQPMVEQHIAAVPTETSSALGRIDLAPNPYGAPGGTWQYHGGDTHSSPKRRRLGRD